MSTKTIKKIDAAITKELANIAVEALRNAGLNIEVTPAGGSYESYGCTIKIKVKLESEEAEKSHADTVNAIAEMYGLTGGIYGKTFEFKDSTYEIINFDTKKIKYPVIAANQNGTKYKFDIAFIKRKLGL